MEDRIKNISLGVGEVISALWTVISLYLDFAGYISKYDLRLLALIGFLVFVVLVLYHIISLRNELYSVTPNVVLWEDGENPYVSVVQHHRTRPSGYIPSGQFTEIKTSRMAHVKFANCPKSPTDRNVARSVSAKITFYDVNNKVLLGPKYGRWGDTKEPGSLTPDGRVAILNMELPSNGNPRGLDLVMKYQEDKDWYFYNNDNYFFDNWIDEQHRLKEDRIIVEVQLIGERVNRKFRFVLGNEGIGGGIIVEKQM